MMQNRDLMADHVEFDDYLDDDYPQDKKRDLMAQIEKFVVSNLGKLGGGLERATREEFEEVTQVSFNEELIMVRIGEPIRR